MTITLPGTSLSRPQPVALGDSNWKQPLLVAEAPSASAGPSRSPGRFCGLGTEPWPQSSQHSDEPVCQLAVSGPPSTGTVCANPGNAGLEGAQVVMA